jgi:hypothetical protein
LFEATADAVGCDQHQAALGLVDGQVARISPPNPLAELRKGIRLGQCQAWHNEVKRAG